VKALVTGSNGFLGVALVDRLLAQGETEVRCLVRSGSALGRLQAVLSRHPSRAEVVVGSLGSAAAAAPLLEGIDVVYHLAAGMKGAPADMTLNTVVSSKRLLEAVAGANLPVRLVLISSFSVYGVADLARGTVINEQTPLEAHPEWRDPYAQVKLRQERLFREYAERHALPLTILRPGVIYGPGGAPFSSRVGLNFGGLLLHFGGSNLLPLSYVDNCADAIIAAGQSERATGRAFNVHDDDLPTAREYLRGYRERVGPIRSLWIPYPLLRVGARLLVWYNRRSQGQLPAALTPYRVASSWKGFRFDNAGIKSLGWRQGVSTSQGLAHAFDDLKRARLAL
jgi:nucleoside-diphosphate-sugar epimerase